MADKNPFILQNSKEVYKNPWITVREDSVIRPGGKEGIFGVIDVCDGVMVAAITKQGEILLAREYSYGAGEYTLECVGGATDSGEEHFATAKRELKEETGAVSDDWQYLGYTRSLTTVADFKSHLYVANNIEIEFDQNLDEGEVIDVIKVPLAEAVEKVTSGEIVHDASVVAILRTHLLLNQ